MKKQSFFVLLLSAFLLTGCVNDNSSKPASESKEPESSQQQTSESNGEQSQSQSQPSSSKSSSSSSSQAGPSGTALNLTAPENDIHTDLQYSYLKDPDWRNIKAYIPTTGADGGNKGDKSQPKALELKFEDVADAQTYYVQVSKDNTFANAKVFTSTKKSYDFYNAEIGVKY